MSKPHRIQKTVDEKVSDLDAHIFLLREHLYHLNDGEAHLKALSTELRVLICYSKIAHLEGLLWRLVNEFKVSDKVYLHVTGSVYSLC